MVQIEKFRPKNKQKWEINIEIMWVTQELIHRNKHGFFGLKSWLILVIFRTFRFWYLILKGSISLIKHVRLNRLNAPAGDTLQAIQIQRLNKTNEIWAFAQMINTMKMPDHYFQHSEFTKENNVRTRRVWNKCYNNLRAQYNHAKLAWMTRTQSQSHCAIYYVCM